MFAGFFITFRLITLKVFDYLAYFKNYLLSIFILIIGLTFINIFISLLWLSFVIQVLIITIFVIIHKNEIKINMEKIKEII